MTNTTLADLFRSESRKIQATLIKIFGFDYIEEIDDAVQETFLSAFEAWKLRGTPENPIAWLYAVSKNKIINRIQRQKSQKRIIEKNNSMFPMEYQLEAVWEREIKFIDDNTLQTLFAICDPEISEDGQTSLALKILYGFTTKEISDLFFTNLETVQKRIHRAKQVLRLNGKMQSLGEKKDLIERLVFVVKIIYLIFTKGYFSFSEKGILQKELVRESLRLAILLSENESCKTADVYALISLISFHSSRLESRINETGLYLSLPNQNRENWNQELIKKGKEYLTKSIQNSGGIISDYQHEATIAYLHTEEDTEQKWNQLESLYSQLYKITKNPMVFLSLIFSIYKNRGASVALKALDDGPKILPSIYYFLTLSKIWEEIDLEQSNQFFEKALQLTNSEDERQMLLLNRNFVV